MIKILVDSASDVDLQEAEGAGVFLIPITVRFGDEEYQDGINLTHREIGRASCRDRVSAVV